MSKVRSMASAVTSTSQPDLEEEVNLEEIGKANDDHKPSENRNDKSKE